MKKRVSFLYILLVIMCLVPGCGEASGGGNVKVYSDTEEATLPHEEKLLTGVLSFKDDTGSTMGFIDTLTGETYILGYNGGVALKDKYGKDLTRANLSCGTVCDVTYYPDTKKMVSVQINGNTTVITGTKKFSVNPENKTAMYKGTTVALWESATVYEGEKTLQIDEISTEDEVTLNILKGKLVSVILTKGHGYVRLLNQDTYVGGLVEIGYDVIVPVTTDMLVAVGEGDYTLRINKDGFSDSKKVHVKRDTENVVDLVDIAIPDGTISFRVEPSDAENVKITVGDRELTAGTFTGVFGTYTYQVEAKGYQTVKGRFRLEKPSSQKTVKLTKIEEEETTAETTTEEKKATGSDASSTSATATTTGAQTTEGGTNADNKTTTGDSTESVENAGKVTENKMTIQTPAGVGVYIDGEYAGDTPVTVTKVVGVHTITLYKSGYFIKTYTITALDNGEDIKLDYPELIKVGSD